MHILYDKLDCGQNDADGILDRVVCMLLYVRTGVFDKKAMQTWVKAEDGEDLLEPPGKRKSWVYNHHVPHSRILKAIEANILGMTRRDALLWLHKVAVTDLKIVPDNRLNQLFPFRPTNRRAYDAWVDWCIGSICDWRENIFYGPGTGDSRGTSIDYPKDGSRSDEQLARVEKAARTLQQAMNNKLSLDKVVRHTGHLVLSPGTGPLQGTRVEYDGRCYWANLFNDLSYPDFEEEDDSDDENYNPKKPNDLGAATKKSKHEQKLEKKEEHKKKELEGKLPVKPQNSVPAKQQNMPGKQGNMPANQQKKGLNQRNKPVGFALSSKL